MQDRSHYYIYAQSNNLHNTLNPFNNSVGAQNTREKESTYHIWTNMGVRRGIIQGISIQSIIKREVINFSSMYI